MAVRTVTTLQSVMESAQSINQKLTNEFDTNGAQTKAEELYADGINLVRGEISGQPSFSEIALSVVIELGKVISI